MILLDFFLLRNPRKNKSKQVIARDCIENNHDEVKTFCTKVSTLFRDAKCETCETDGCNGAKIVLILTVITTLRHLNHAATMYPRMPDNMPEMPEYDAMLRDIQRKSMGHPDPKVGEMLASMGPNSRRNPEEMGTYYQGDLLTPMDLMKKCKMSNDDLVRRWYNAKVPYTFHRNMRSNFQEIKLIESAMQEIQKHTCVCFVKHEREADYLEIDNSATGCSSALGRTCGRQPLNLDSNGCLDSIRTPIHELMHALGVPHEHERKDRDSYIRINYSSLMNKTKEHDFKNLKIYDGFGTPYDYSSIMHYSLTAFAKPQTNTMEPITRLGILSNSTIGRNKHLTRNDIYKINHLYGCHAKFWLPRPKKHHCPHQ